MTTDPQETDVETRSVRVEPDTHAPQDDDPDVEAHMPRIIKLGAEDPQAASDT